MGIVQIVRRTNGNIIDLLATATELVHMPVEPLKLHKEIRFRKEAIDRPDRVVGIEDDLEIAANGFDRLHMPWRDITGGPYQSEVLHQVCSLSRARYRTSGESIIHPSAASGAKSIEAQAASTSSASRTTFTLRPRRSSKMATRSPSVIPSNKPKQSENTPSDTRTLSPGENRGAACRQT